MIGIPYFYRLFGYEYAIDINPALAVTGRPGEGTHALRAAGPDDLPAIAALQDSAQAGFDVVMPHSAACWRWLLRHDASTLQVVERAGAVVAAARVRQTDEELLLAEAAAADASAAADLLQGVAAMAPDRRLRLVHRPGTVTASAWTDLLDPEPRRQAEQYYIRIPRLGELLDRLRPLLWQRLTAAGIDRSGRDIVVSTFGAHYRIPVRSDGLDRVVTGGVMQGPGAAGGVGVAPDQLPALLFGPLGIDGLSRIRPDVYATDQELFRALFPPLTADVLSYYLPY